MDWHHWAFLLAASFSASGASRYEVDGLGRTLSLRHFDSAALSFVPDVPIAQLPTSEPRCARSGGAQMRYNPAP